MQFFTLCGLLCLVVVGSEALSCPRLVSRQNWGARTATSTTPMDGKPYTVIIKDIGVNCYSRGKCPTTVKDVQYSDMLIDSKPDVTCNFLIGSDGAVYDGRGWSNAVQGNKAIVVCVLGIFAGSAPDSTQTSTIKDFLACDDTQSKLASDYTVQAWKDIYVVSSNPGAYLYEVVQKLPNYKTPATTPKSVVTAH